MALLSLSRTQIYELIPSPLALLAGWNFALREPARPQKRLQMSAVLSCYPPASGSNHAQGQRAGRQTQPPTGRKMMIMARSTVKSEVVPLLYRVDEAAAALRLSRSSVYELIRSGQLRSVKQGRRRLVPVTALAEYVASLGGAA
jgi:excisionase family DNA binding protein